MDVFFGKIGHLTTMARPFTAFTYDRCNRALFHQPSCTEQLVLSAQLYSGFCHFTGIAKAKRRAAHLALQLQAYSQKRELAFVPLQISLAAWSATLPIVQGAFGGSSPYFLAGNLLVVPLIIIMIWACVPLLVFASLLPQEVLDLYETVWLSLMSAADYLLFVLKELR